MSGTTALTAGEGAPEFRLRDQNGTVVSSAALLSSRNLLVVFFPFAFSGICTGELSQIRDDLGAFVSDDIDVVAISCDPIFALRAWADQQAYFFPILSDFWPHGDVARGFGVFDEGGGYARRGTFLLDTTGTVRWSLVKDLGETRDLTAFRETLASLS